MNKKHFWIPLVSSLSCTSASIPLEKTADYCLTDVSANEILAPYYEQLRGNHKILGAIDFCQLPIPWQATMWGKIQDSEINRRPPTAPLPASFYNLKPNQNSIQLTEEEAREIYAAKLAHALWLDFTGIVAWKLSDYGQTELEELLLPQAWFSAWKPSQQRYEFTGLIDYSPAETFSILEEKVDLNSLESPELAIVEIMKGLRDYVHGSVEDAKEINTMKGMSEEKISRHGCQTMAPYFIQLANVLNLPGKTKRNYYLDGGAHRAAMFEFTDFFLPHGDHFYNLLLANTPSSELMESYAFWQENVFVHNAEEWAEDDVRYFVGLHSSRKAMKYPSQQLMKKYCVYGHNYLKETFGFWAASPELDLLEKRLLDLTKSCSIFPEDNPDGMFSASE